MLSALVLISPMRLISHMGVTLDRGYIANNPTFNALVSIGVIFGCIGSFRYFFPALEKSSRTKRVLLFYVAPALIGIVLLLVLNLYINPDDSDLKRIITHIHDFIFNSKNIAELYKDWCHDKSITVVFTDAIIKAAA